MRCFPTAAAVATLFAVAAAAPQAKAQLASPNPKAVKPGTYKVEPYHTQVVFSVSHFGFTNFSGLFADASGTLILDPATPAASKLDVRIPTDSVITTVPLLTKELKGPHWFDSAQFPTATFVSAKIIRTGPTTATIDGNLTLHGVTKPMTLTAKFNGAGINPLDKAYTIGFQATGLIKRGEFGVSMYLPMVGDEVRLTIAGAFERKT